MVNNSLDNYCKELLTVSQQATPNPTTEKVLRLESYSHGSQKAPRINNRRQKPETMKQRAKPAKLILVTPSDEGDKLRRADKRGNSGVFATLMLYVLRLLILGVGLGAIAGTALTVIKPNNFFGINIGKSSQTEKPQPKTTAKVDKPETTTTTIKLVEPLTLTQELTPLKQKLQAVVKKYPKLTPELFFVDVDNGAYVDISGETPIPAASTIKVPILVAFLQDVDAGKVRLDEILVASKDVMTSGSGDMQYLGVDKKYTALETATKMIIISDNSATNMLIKRLGGKDLLNQRFQEWGLTSTMINNRLPDLEGTNTTSPRDLVNLLTKVNQGELISLKSRDRLFGIMQQTKTRTLLPPGLEEDAVIAHKTGDIGSVLGDTGIIDMPSGKRYIGAVLVKRPHNDVNGRLMIQEISRTVYQHLKGTQTKPPKMISPSPTPSISPIVKPSPKP